jgi:hypothetical protein
MVKPGSVGAAAWIASPTKLKAPAHHGHGVEPDRWLCPALKAPGPEAQAELLAWLPIVTGHWHAALHSVLHWQALKG